MISWRRRTEESVNYNHHPMNCFMGGLILDGGGNATCGLDLAGMIGSTLDSIRFKGIPGTLVELKWTMMCAFRRLFFFERFLDGGAVVPAIGFDFLAQTIGAIPVENTVNTFDACEVGSAVIGIRMMSGFNNVFNGGAFESGTQGFYIGPDVKWTIFNGVDFEANSGLCELHGYENVLNAGNCTGSRLRLGPTSYRNALPRGQWFNLLDEGKDNQYDPQCFGNAHTDDNTTAATTSRMRMQCDTTAAEVKDFALPGGTTLKMPRDAVYRVNCTITAYCKGGVNGNVGKTWTKRFDKVFQTVGGVISQVSDHSPSNDAAPNGWVCDVAVWGNTAGRSIIAYVTGAVGDTIHWAMDMEIVSNGGTGVALTAVERIQSIVNTHGGFWARASSAVMNSGAMTVPDASANGINLVAPLAAGSPTVGTLADTVTPAIVCSGNTTRGLIPSATLGTSTSHTFIVVGEPAAVEAGIAILLWGGTISSNPSISITQYSATIGPRIQVGATVGPTVAGTTGLQVLEMSLDDVTNTATIYRNGVSVGSAAYSVSQAIGAFANIGILGGYDSTLYGAKGKFTDVLCAEAAITANERALLQRAFKDLYAALP
jgi:hypothetical protein